MSRYNATEPLTTSITSQESTMSTTKTPSIGQSGYSARVRTPGQPLRLELTGFDCPTAKLWHGPTKSHTRHLYPGPEQSPSVPNYIFQNHVANAYMNNF